MVAAASWRVRSSGVDPDDPRLYVQIAGQIRGLIESGELAPGDPVPSINTLVQDHGVARQTAAKALQLLEDEGLTRRVPGLGYYVKKPASRS
jgi:DNA-binding GntR family transcriptional regulator